MDERLTRRAALQYGSAGLLAAAGCLAGPRDSVAAEPAAEPKSFRFAHLTDIHVQAELGAERGFRQCIAAVNELRPRPDFVVTGGDLVMDVLDVPYDRARALWKMYEDACRDLAMPVFHTIGNHDVLGWSSKGAIPTDHLDYGKKMFADHVGQGRTYRSFDHGGWHFVLLDSIGPGSQGDGYKGYLDEPQIEWLKADLAAVGRQKPVVLVTHIPFYSTWLQMAKGPQEAAGEGYLITNGYTVRKLLEQYNVRLVLQGHIHIRERLDYLNTSYIISGAVSGAWWKGLVDGKHPEGFAVVDVTPDDFQWSYHTYGWQAVKA